MSKNPNHLLSQALNATKSGFATVIFFSFFINLLTFVGPLFMLQIYDRVLNSRSTTTLMALAAIAVFLLIVFAVLEKVRLTILHRLGLLFDSIVRARLFAAVTRGTMLNPQGGHGQALRDLDLIRDFLAGSGPLAFSDIPWMPIFIAGCFLLHAWFGWIAIVGAILIFAFAIANEFATRAHLKAASRTAVMAAGFASAAMRNAEVLLAMGMLDALRRRWMATHRQVLELQTTASDRSGMFMSAAKLVRAVLQIAILGVGGYLAIERQVSPAAMIAASIIIGRALAPVELSVANWARFLEARSAYERIAALFNVVPEQAERMRLPAPRGHISMEDVFAGPPNSDNIVLRGVSFSLEPGELLGVIGHSAAGKSTLARALVGVWPTMRGEIRIDGADLAHWHPEQLGPQIGYLPQDVELFPGTIAENICRFGAIEEDRIVEAAMAAGVHNMVQRLPEGYNTQIGEGGCALSGGQRQRIGLARALYGRPALLVLDEPNASLDAEGEAALMAALEQVCAARQSVILITHKTSILAYADKILILKQGQVQAFAAREEIFPDTQPRVAHLAPMAIAS